VPIQGESEVLGILNVATSEYGRFTPPQLQLLSAIGFMLGTAITRTRLHEQVKVRRVHEQAALLKLSQELLGAESIEPALQRLVRVGAPMPAHSSRPTSARAARCCWRHTAGATCPKTRRRW
jgi:sigma-B regulation protein RsbU (phosphoserine phosphatase)